MGQEFFVRRKYEPPHRVSPDEPSERPAAHHDLNQPRPVDRFRDKLQPSRSYEHLMEREWIRLHMIYAWLAVGGALGTMSRYAVSGWVVHRFGPSPLGTFTVNIAGAFLIGLILVLTEGRFLVPGDLRIFLTTGFLGGFTTFSTFMFETMGLVEAGSLQRAFVNAGGSLAAGLVAVWLGMTVARLI
jgi:fluoride exporter